MLTIKGTFLGSSDNSLVMATHPTIASEFDALGMSSWLLTAFSLGGATTQITVSKLGEIFGRKQVVLTAHVAFALGCGVGQSMWQVILARLLSGSAGAGLGVLTSLVITDLVPLREVAVWRSYVNVASTLGRSVGAPLGGWLADAIGWRWSFIGQGPLILLAALFVWISFPGQLSQGEQRQTTLALSRRLARIDWAGAFLLALTIASVLLPLEIGGVNVPWSHPIILCLFAGHHLFLAGFIYIETRLVQEPIIDLSIFRDKHVLGCFGIMFLQISAQIGLMFSVPLYFKVTAGASNAEAGARLFPAALGNTVAGIMAGIFIKRTGNHQALLITGTLLSVFGYLLIILRWHGNTNWLESLYILVSGFGTGFVQSAVFISLQSAVEKTQLTAAISCLYLSVALGSTQGLAMINAVLQMAVRRNLGRRLADIGLDPVRRDKIIADALDDVSYIRDAPAQIAKAITTSYVHALESTHCK
ncbi:major facilitator superfamily domain-containing protein [Fusarium solani]|uniref:Major facilitator superfamily domain-containing protein n=1 Tax=Fusarium solani TaxID=169388 RepID=A0A9P9H8V5_FUSSL|nr:major facilitator superfamily domain-containing protein [Fusarium solani]KAH7253279.1 major facilitator superfamily domain-containing protein [Fusarium solani]